MGGGGSGATRNGTAAGKSAAAAAAAADGDDLKFSSLLGVLIAFPSPAETEAFEPLASELPPALLPVNGLPLIDYGIELMHRNGVTELHVLARDDAGGHAVKAIIERQQQRQQQQQQQRQSSCSGSSSNRQQPLRIHCLMLSAAVQTVGDALRDFESRVDVRNTFLLMSASTLAVGDLRAAIAAHSARVSSGGRGGDSALTWVLKVSPPCSRQRSLNDDAVVVYDGDTLQLLAFTSMQHKKGLPIDEQLLARATPGAAIRVRYDVSLPELYICEPSVLRLFGQSFDFGCLQRHLIPHLLKEDLQMETVHCHILEAERQPSGQLYAMTARDPRAYQAILLDVLERWTFPLAPDSHAMETQEYLKYRGRGVYQASTVSAGVGGSIGPLAAIEGDSSIADNTEIRESFIGQRCSIGSNCEIVGSLLLADVTVETGAVIRDSLIASKCIIRRGAVLNRGCLLAPGVVVGQGVSLPPLTRCCLPEAPALQRLEAREETGAAPAGLAAAQGEAAAARAAAAAAVSLGPDGKGTVFVYQGLSPPADFEALNVGSSVLPRIRLPIPKFEGADDDAQSRASDACTALSDTEGALSSSSQQHQEDETFSVEIGAMCLEALQQPQQQQHKILEMKSFRLACNKTDADIADIALTILLQQLALKAPRSKEGWTSFVDSRRCRSLLASFVESSEDAQGFYSLWGQTVSFCSKKEIVYTDTEGEETRAPNPFEGPRGFCEVAELLHAADLFDVDLSLAPWAAAAAAVAKGDSTETLAAESLRHFDSPAEVLPFLETPRLKAFIEWLQEDSEDSD